MTQEESVDISLSREESSEHQRREITSLVIQTPPRRTSLLLLWRRAWAEEGLYALPHAVGFFTEGIKRIIYSCNYQSQSFGFIGQTEDISQVLVLLK